MAEHAVQVAPIPAWVDAQRLLGPTGTDAGWQLEPDGGRAVVARARLSSAVAADLAARLRGVGLDGAPLVCAIDPPLRRPLVRKARTEDARRRRATTPGFTRSGARFDDEGRWSLTPESLATRMAAGVGPGARVVDAGCGLGGNAIAFARAGGRVDAIERDLDRLALARHNAAVYGVADRVRFHHGDAVELVERLAGPDAILFVDPPWGTGWDRAHCGLADLPLLAQLLPLAAGFAELWVKLPPSFATAELADVGASTRARAWFGEAEGDARRIKFVTVEIELAPAPASG